MSSHNPTAAQLHVTGKIAECPDAAECFTTRRSGTEFRPVEAATEVELWVNWAKGPVRGGAFSQADS